jgi:cobalamin-dependent methionine synthase I
LLKTKTKEVRSSTEGPIVVIGERINPKGNMKLAATYKEGRNEYVRQLTQHQIVAVLLLLASLAS